MHNDRELNEHDDEKDWTFVEARLQSFCPRPARLDMQAIQRSRDDLIPTSSARSVDRSSAARFLGTWSFGVAVGAAAMLCFVRWTDLGLQSESTQPATSPIVQSPIVQSPTGDRSMETKNSEGSMDDSRMPLPSSMDVAVNRLATIGSSPLHAGFHLIFNNSASVNDNSPDSMMDIHVGPENDDDAFLRKAENRSLFEPSEQAPKSRDQLLKELMNESQGRIY